MKKLLVILFLFITANTFAQRDTVVIKIPAQATIDTSHLRNDINGKVNISDSVVKYITPTQLGAKRDTSYKQTLNVFKPIYSVKINDSTIELHSYMSVDSTLSNASDTSLVSSLAVKIKIKNDSLALNTSFATKKNNSDSTNSITGYTTLYQNSLKISAAVANATFATIDSLNLKANDNAVLHTTGSLTETVTGTKTFNNSFQTNASTISYWGNGLAYGFLSWNTGKAIIGAQTGNALSFYANGVEKIVIGTDGKARYFSSPVMTAADSLALVNKKFVDSLPLQKTLVTASDRLTPAVGNNYFFGDDTHKWKGIYTKTIYADSIRFSNAVITYLPSVNSIPEIVYSDSNNSTVTPVLSVAHRSYNGSTGIGSSVILRTSNNIYGSDFTGAEIQTSATNMSDISYDYRVKTMIGNVLSERFRISDKANFLINQQLDTFYRKLYVNGPAGINGKLYVTKGALFSNKRLTHKIYTIGNSLTYSSGLGTYQNYLKSLLTIPWEITNDGVAGNTTAQILTRYRGTIIDPGDAEYVIIEGGVNDVIQGVSAIPIQNNLQAMYNLAKANGIKVVALNIFPFKGNVNWTSTKQSTLDSVNNWIATTATNIDYKIDTYSKLEDPSNLDQLLPAYDDGAHLHLTVAGYDSVGAAINAGATFVYSNATSAFDVDGKVHFVAHPSFTVVDSLAVTDKKYVDSVFANVGANVASASAITPTGNTFHVTGTTAITSITATNVKVGSVITIIFDGILTFTDGSNLKLSGNFTTSPDATITLRYDGTNFYEMSRSTN